MSPYWLAVWISTLTSFSPSASNFSTTLPVQVIWWPRCVMPVKRTPNSRSWRWSTHCVSRRPR